MTQVATPTSLPDDMSKLDLTFNGREYKGERRGDKFFIRVRSEGGSLGEPQQVVLLTGSHTLQIPWLESEISSLQAITPREILPAWARVVGETGAAHGGAGKLRAKSPEL